MKHLSSKKVVVFLLVFVTATAIWYFSEGSTFPEWGNFTKWIVGLYFGGNVGEHGAEALSKQNKTI